jgi:ribose-phosphate pyrophosphokinase
MDTIILALPGAERLAETLAQQLHCAASTLELHRFPDGEGVVRLRTGVSGQRVLLVAHLDRPDDKTLPLVFAADAARELGAAELGLVAPYLPYMRQDASFHYGEAVSQWVMGQILDRFFSAIVTVDPHLHRTPSLDRLFPSTKSLCLSARLVLAGMISSDQADALLVGPDIESSPLVGAVAADTGCDWLCLSKVRRSDRDVRINIKAAIGSAAGRRAILIDDVCSSGSTLVEAARLLRAAGALSVEALVVHALHDAAAAAAMQKAGIRRLRSTDSVLHPSNGAALAPLLADALKDLDL